MMNIPKLIDDIVGWIKKYCEKNGIDSLIVGVSGGIDSAVVTCLCEKTGIKTICVSLPYEYDQVPMDLATLNSENPMKETSTRRAYYLCRGRKVEYFIKAIQPIVLAYKNAGFGETQLLEGNLRSRIRANILYDFAAKNNGIVVGTGNKDEDQIGYFTKGGDGLCDVCPLSNLHKSIVYEIAKVFGDIPQDIIDAAPTAELWENQTDENELGMTYDEVEWALRILGRRPIAINRMEKKERDIVNKVKNMVKKNDHKLRYPPIFDPNNPENIE